MSNLKELLMKEIIVDEKEYCFDKGYCNDESWKEQNGDQTREDAFKESIEFFNSKTSEEIMTFFGDKYDYVLEKYNINKL